jgi:anti-sigma regulatory factor (Ser/Thr protein kinase)
MRLDQESGYAITIEDSSQVGEARRNASAIATASGLTEVEAGKLAIIATEAATNIAKHATRGEIILRSVVGDGIRAVDLIAIDAGPGILDVDRALGDGYSTAGTLGRGLGAMARMATEFDIFSAPGAGTVLVARIESERTKMRDRPAYDIGVVRVAKRGETECGDDWGIVVGDGGRALLAVADGLGHGGAAAEASRRAVAIAAEHTAEHPALVVEAMHAGLRPTRGAAVAVAELTLTDGLIRYCGVGNISAAIVSSGSSRSLVSHNGIAGHEMRKIQEFVYEWPADALLVMHSDGVSARWDLSRYPGLALRHPSVVAGVLYRDFSRGRDDALVVVVRAAARSRRAQGAR